MRRRRCVTSSTFNQLSGHVYTYIYNFARPRVHATLVVLHKIVGEVVTNAALLLHTSSPLSAALLPLTHADCRARMQSIRVAFGWHCLLFFTLESLTLDMAGTDQAHPLCDNVRNDGPPMNRVWVTNTNWPMDV